MRETVASQRGAPRGAAAGALSARRRAVEMRVVEYAVSPFFRCLLTVTTLLFIIIFSLLRQKGIFCHAFIIRFPLYSHHFRLHRTLRVISPSAAFHYLFMSLAATPRHFRRQTSRHHTSHYIVFAADIFIFTDIILIPHVISSDISSLSFSFRYRFAITHFRLSFFMVSLSGEEGTPAS